LTARAAKIDNPRRLRRSVSPASARSSAATSWSICPPGWCRPWRNESSDRSGIEKHGSPSRT